MHSAKLYSALLAAGASVASAASATCTSDITITEPTPTITCDVVHGNLIIDPSVAGDVEITGLKQVMGSLIATNASHVLSISSPSINSVTGELHFENLELAHSIEFLAMKQVHDMTLMKMPQLSTVDFNSDGVQQAHDITVTDTFLGTMSSFPLVTFASLVITNNRKLTKLQMPTVNFTTLLSISSNGAGMEVSFASLKSGGEIQISDVAVLDLPKLEKQNGSLKLDRNQDLQTLAAPELETLDGSLTSINNIKLTNISFPLLQSVGDLTIQNNTALLDLTLPALETVNGGVICAGSFQNVTLDKLSDVKGGVTVTSTTDIGDVCDFFDNAKKSGIIQGSEKCTSNNTKANEGGDGGSTGHGSSGGNQQSAAFSMTNNMGLALGLLVLTGIAQLL